MSNFLRLILSFSLLFSGCISGGKEAFATVSNNINTVPYAGDGVTTTFAFNYPVYLNTDLSVYEQVVSTGVQTTLTLNTNYTVILTPISNNSGSYTASINLAGGSSPAGAPPVGTNLVIVRNVPYTQNINISDYSQTPAATWNQALDRSTILSQQLYALTNRSVLQSVSATTPITLPPPALGQYLVWGTGSTLINSSGSGSQGPPGQGVPTGGTAGQLLTKNSGTNYDASWTSPATNGTVTSVTSANADISVANTTTTPVLTLNSGSTANKIVKLDSSARLPAVDGSQLTNLPNSTFNFVPNSIQTFTTTGTWHKPAGVSNVYVKVIGAGGAGGAGRSTATAASAGGGGAGGYAEGVIAVTGDVTVTIGATNSFAGQSTIQATAGSAGVAPGSNQTGAGGAGGVGSGGTINLTGASGSGGVLGTTGVGGKGGDSVMGGGGIGGATWNGGYINATAGLAYGGGGGGGGVSNSDTGGAGDPGAVIVYY